MLRLSAEHISENIKIKEVKDPIELGKISLLQDTIRDHGPQQNVPTHELISKINEGISYVWGAYNEK